eukprot:Gregarina_sp_Poly_1__10671@NODE_805_length_6225_cov_104_656057_g60_i1_p1_GENE_NODE_805_length_6225_cov_104_656057_g60_i1NODE_805_length_6225_cov_104_656057_g60_i1_p1_ORF_typecomplete_len1877_score234_45Pkinase/PF00069_25/2_8e05Pkinase_Tyr/PF07714_17/0_0096_NODE_805_length_6225_cov_104_656057_g60_i15056135
MILSRQQRRRRLLKSLVQPSPTEAPSSQHFLHINHELLAMRQSRICDSAFHRQRLGPSTSSFASLPAPSPAESVSSALVTVSERLHRTLSDSAVSRATLTSQRRRPPGFSSCRSDSEILSRFGSTAAQIRSPSSSASTTPSVREYSRKGGKHEALILNMNSVDNRRSFTEENIYATTDEPSSYVSTLPYDPAPDLRPCEFRYAPSRKRKSSDRTRSKSIDHATTRFGHQRSTKNFPSASNLFSENHFTAAHSTTSSSLPRSSLGQTPSPSAYIQVLTERCSLSASPRRPHNTRGFTVSATPQQSRAVLVDPSLPNLLSSECVLTGTDQICLTAVPTDPVPTGGNESPASQACLCLPPPITTDPHNQPRPPTEDGDTAARLLLSYSQPGSSSVTASHSLMPSSRSLTQEDEAVPYDHQCHALTARNKTTAEELSNSDKGEEADTVPATLEPNLGKIFTKLDSGKIDDNVDNIQRRKASNVLDAELPSALRRPSLRIPGVASLGDVRLAECTQREASESRLLYYRSISPTATGAQTRVPTLVTRRLLREASASPSTIAFLRRKSVWVPLIFFVLGFAVSCLLFARYAYQSFLPLQRNVADSAFSAVDDMVAISAAPTAEVVRPDIAGSLNNVGLVQKASSLMAEPAGEEWQLGRESDDTVAVGKANLVAELEALVPPLSRVLLVEDVHGTIFRLDWLQEKFIWATPLGQQQASNASNDFAKLAGARVTYAFPTGTEDGTLSSLVNFCDSCEVADEFDLTGTAEGRQVELTLEAGMEAARLVATVEGQVVYLDYSGEAVPLGLTVEEILGQAPFKTPLFPGVFLTGSQERSVQPLLLSTGDLMGRCALGKGFDLKVANPLLPAGECPEVCSIPRGLPFGSSASDAEMPSGRGGPSSWLHFHETGVQVDIARTSWIVKAVDSTTHEERWKFAIAQMSPVHESSVPIDQPLLRHCEESDSTGFPVATDSVLLSGGQEESVRFDCLLAQVDSALRQAVQIEGRQLLVDLCGIHHKARGAQKTPWSQVCQDPRMRTRLVGKYAFPYDIMNVFPLRVMASNSFVADTGSSSLGSPLSLTLGSPLGLRRRPLALKSAIPEQLLRSLHLHIIGCAAKLTRDALLAHETATLTASSTLDATALGTDVSWPSLHTYFYNPHRVALVSTDEQKRSLVEALLTTNKKPSAVVGVDTLYTATVPQIISSVGHTGPAALDVRAQRDTLVATPLVADPGPEPAPHNRDAVVSRIQTDSKQSSEILTTHLTLPTVVVGEAAASTVIVSVNLTGAPFPFGLTFDLVTVGAGVSGAGFLVALGWWAHGKLSNSGADKRMADSVVATPKSTSSGTLPPALVENPPSSSLVEDAGMDQSITGVISLASLSASAPASPLLPSSDLFPDRSRNGFHDPPSEDSGLVSSGLSSHQEGYWHQTNTGSESSGMGDSRSYRSFTLQAATSDASPSGTGLSKFLQDFSQVSDTCCDDNDSTRLQGQVYRQNVRAMHSRRAPTQERPRKRSRLSSSSAVLATSCPIATASWLSDAEPPLSRALTSEAPPAGDSGSRHEEACFSDAAVFFTRSRIPSAAHTSASLPSKSPASLSAQAIDISTQQQEAQKAAPGPGGGFISDTLKKVGKRFFGSSALSGQRIPATLAESKNAWKKMVKKVGLSGTTEATSTRCATNSPRPVSPISTRHTQGGTPLSMRPHPPLTGEGFAPPVVAGADSATVRDIIVETSSWLPTERRLRPAAAGTPRSSGCQTPCSQAAAAPTQPESFIPPDSPLGQYVENGRFARTFTDGCIVGKGGFGVVYKVRHRLEPGNTMYALKMVKLEVDVYDEVFAQRRSFREVAANRDLFSKYVVRYFTWWCEEPQFLPSEHVQAFNTSIKRSPPGEKLN